jgi:hypothetical protein
MNNEWRNVARLVVGAVLVAVSGACGDDSTSAGDSQLDSDAGTQNQASSEPDPCLAGCVPTDVKCEETVDTYPNQADTTAEWTKRCEGAQNFWAVEGRCDDGSALLLFGTGTSSDWRQFDTSGAFVALQLGADFVATPNECLAMYWPKAVKCENAVVTARICGRSTLPIGAALPH